MLVSEQQVDIMLSPSMVSVRARALCIPWGRSKMDSDQTDTGLMFAEAPTQGIKVIYTMVGDLLGWVYLVGNIR